MAVQRHVRGSCISVIRGLVIRGLSLQSFKIGRSIRHNMDYLDAIVKHYPHLLCSLMSRLLIANRMVYNVSIVATSIPTSLPFLTGYPKMTSTSIGLPFS